MIPERTRVAASKRVLLVDDNEDVLRAYARRLRAAQIDAETTSDVGSALRLLRDRRFDWILIDLMMPGSDGRLKPIGISLAEKVLEIAPKSDVVLMTAYPSFEAAVQAGQLNSVGRVHWYVKSEPIAKLFALVQGQAPTRGLEGIPPPDEAARLRERYLTVLLATGGNLSEAARMLDLSRQAVQKHIRSDPQLSALLNDARRCSRDPK